MGLVPLAENVMFTLTLVPGAPDPPDNETEGCPDAAPIIAARVQIGTNFTQNDLQITRSGCVIYVARIAGFYFLLCRDLCRAKQD